MGVGGWGWGLGLGGARGFRHAAHLCARLLGARSRGASRLNSRARPRGFRFGSGRGLGKAEQGAHPFRVLRERVARARLLRERPPREGGLWVVRWASVLGGSVVDSGQSKWFRNARVEPRGNREARRASRLRMFLARVLSATTACTSAAEHEPSAPAISIAAQASQHSQSAMAYARLLSARVWRAAPSALLSAADTADLRA